MERKSKQCEEHSIRLEGTVFSKSNKHAHVDRNEKNI